MGNTQAVASKGRRFVQKEDRQHLPRVKVLAMDGTPLVPMDFREARIAVRDNLAIGKHINGEYHVQMLREVGKGSQAA